MSFWTVAAVPGGAVLAGILSLSGALVGSRRLRLAQDKLVGSQASIAQGQRTASLFDRRMAAYILFIEAAYGLPQVPHLEIRNHDRVLSYMAELTDWYAKYRTATAQALAFGSDKIVQELKPLLPTVDGQLSGMMFRLNGIKVSFDSMTKMPPVEQVRHESGISVEYSAVAAESEKINAVNRLVAGSIQNEIRREGMH